MKIISWNVAGLRACIKKGALNFLLENDFEILCLQETKALEKEVKIPKELEVMYPYRYWGENHGITQRKGLSGTSIWSKMAPIKQLETMELDQEGRITAIEFENYIIVTVYTPNSQCLGSERCEFRTEHWDIIFKEYIKKLNNIKPTIVCGDFNVAHKEIDIYSPEKHKNLVAGFLDIERENFQLLLDEGFIDVFRKLYPNEKNQYTYWDQVRPHMRNNNRGWRIDYFIISQNLLSKVKNCKIDASIRGSDHCPITLELN